MEAKSAPSAASGLEGTSSVIAGIGLKCALLGSVCSNAVARVSASGRQDLVDWPGLKRREKIGEKMRLADRPGSAVLKLGVAMTDAENATPVLRSVSMIVPQTLFNLQISGDGHLPLRRRRSR
ncbi:DUF3313 family protein [Methylococcus capsulatus]|uniref:Uncharacterized protein n=1 Tax=Methylococcus capsulatus TaxID=414 RepID=A0AA35V3Z2_METCP|nr:DUF3313 family protein [Methylococcus capsulatus]CAI8767898.1 protein of unknown function [Methylococcus capsulatus]